MSEQQAEQLKGLLAMALHCRKAAHLLFKIAVS